MLALVKNRLIRPVLALALVAFAGCVTTSATQVQIFESSPVVRHYEEVRRQQAEQDQAAGGSIQKGGCPVCTW